MYMPLSNCCELATDGCLCQRNGGYYWKWLGGVCLADKGKFTLEHMHLADACIRWSLGKDQPGHTARVTVPWVPPLSMWVAPPLNVKTYNLETMYDLFIKM
ncbi:hypothetical protein SEVIR_9G394200v4 [Setaria viridis]